MRCRVSDLQGWTPSVYEVWSLRAFWEAMAACHFALATMENQRSHSRSYTFRYIIILPSPAASCSITSKRKDRNREEDGSQHPKSVLSFGTRTQTPRWVVKPAWLGITMTTAITMRMVMRLVMMMMMTMVMVLMLFKLTVGYGWKCSYDDSDDPCGIFMQTLNTAYWVSSKDFCCCFLKASDCNFCKVNQAVLTYFGSQYVTDVGTIQLGRHDPTRNLF